MANEKNITDINRNLRGSLQHAPLVPIGAISSTDEKRIFTAPYAIDTPPGMVCKIDAVYLTNESTITADNTNYWSVQLSTITPTTVDLLSTAQNTTITSGTTITADTPWKITPDQNQVLLPGAVLELVLTKASSATALFAELSATVIWHWEEA